MSELVTCILGDCYPIVLCAIIISLFLSVNKNYNKSVIRLFLILLGIALLDSVCRGVQGYFESVNLVSDWRIVFIWICFISEAALLLMVNEVMLRDSAVLVKVILAIPELLLIAMTPIVFTTDYIFYYDESNTLCTGVLEVIPRLFVILYMVMLLVIASAIMRRSKWECTIVSVSVLFIFIDYVNEYMDIVPLDLRGISMALTLLTYFMYFTSISHHDEVKEMNLSFELAEEKHTREMIDQTIETLAYTIDAKDRYTKGHSFRVAKYSRMIAKLAGKSESECREIYLAGLLHDIGKISIADSIINKPGKLTPEEYDAIKCHPLNGEKILQKMKSIPFLQDGAKYHHERYDGKGYPCGLSGNDIPELARIIAVADAYDAMTSHRSYRKTMEQVKVREEIWKGIGEQFDPRFGKAMISIIDSDRNFDLREKTDEEDEMTLEQSTPEIVWSNPEEDKIADGAVKTRHSFGELVSKVPIWSPISNPTKIVKNQINVVFNSKTKPEAEYVWNAPTVIVYSSDDGKFLGEGYDELGVYMTAGYNWRSGSSLGERVTFKKSDEFESWENWLESNKEGIRYTLKAHREQNIIYMTVGNRLMSTNVRLVLPEEYIKDVYFVISGDTCDISEPTIKWERIHSRN